MDHAETESHLSSRPAHDADTTEPRHWVEPPTGLRAGETDDNLNWRQYLEYRRNYSGPPVNRYPVRHRSILKLQHPDGAPAHDIPVTITQGNTTIFQGTSYADGRVMFFPRRNQHGPIRAHAGTDQQTFISEIDIGPHPTNLTIFQKRKQPQQQPIDVLFLLDSTGSMADEIQLIKSTLRSISNRVAKMPANPDLRFAMVSYRDRGDEYVTRLYDFDRNVRRFTRTIRNVQAEGGGDYPESLNEALHTAVNTAQWRDHQTIRLIFLVADAPPHLDYPQDYDYTTDMERARARGIKIHAIATSGLDSQGEYIFRQIAQNTLGKFIFLLYPSGPQGELTTPHDVPRDYQPQNLDDIVVDLIAQELRNLSDHHQPRHTNQ